MKTGEEDASHVRSSEDQCFKEGLQRPQEISETMWLPFQKPAVIGGNAPLNDDTAC